MKGVDALARPEVLRVAKDAQRIGGTFTLRRDKLLQAYERLSGRDQQLIRRLIARRLEIASLEDSRAYPLEWTEFDRGMSSYMATKGPP